MWPWQQQLVDVARERDPASGMLAYDTVVVVVGRRGGKSRITHGIPTAEALSSRSTYLAASTAQNMTGATKRLRETWAVFRSSAPELASTSRMLTGVNHASIEWRYRRRTAGGWEPDPTVAALRVFPPTADAVRGDAYRFVSIDEALTLTMNDGQALLEAAGPTLAEHHGNAQLWILSNEGKDPGGWLRDLKRRGRAAAAAGVNRGMCYVEYAMTADDDPADPAVWRRVHPSIGHNLTEAALHAELDRLGVESFAREYLNYATDDDPDEAIPLHAWDGCTPGRRRGTPVVAAFDVTLDRLRCSLVGVTDERHVSLIDTGPLADLPDMIREHADGLPVVALPGQTAVAEQLRRDDIVVRLLSGREYRTACQMLHDDVVARRVHHHHQPQLRAAWERAGRAWHGDTWVLSARRSDGDITAAAAASAAWWTARVTTEAIFV